MIIIRAKDSHRAWHALRPLTTCDERCVVRARVAVRTRMAALAREGDPFCAITYILPISVPCYMSQPLFNSAVHITPISIQRCISPPLHQTLHSPLAFLSINHVFAYCDCIFIPLSFPNISFSFPITLVRRTGIKV